MSSFFYNTDFLMICSFIITILMNDIITLSSIFLSYTPVLVSKDYRRYY